MSRQISLKYESVAGPDNATAIFAVMDRDFISAVGPVSMRDLFENRAAIVESGSEMAIVVQTGGEVDAYVTAALDIAIDAGYQITIDDHSVRSPGSENDVKPAFETISEMITDIRASLAAKRELESRNDQVSPS